MKDMKVVAAARPLLKAATVAPSLPTHYGTVLAEQVPRLRSSLTYGYAGSTFAATQSDSSTLRHHYIPGVTLLRRVAPFTPLDGYVNDALR